MHMRFNLETTKRTEYQNTDKNCHIRSDIIQEIRIYAWPMSVFELQDLAAPTLSDD